MKLTQTGKAWMGRVSVPLAALVVGAIFYLEITNEAGVDLSRPQNAAVWPTMMISGLMIGAAVMLVQRLWGIFRESRAVDGVTQTGDGAEAKLAMIADESDETAGHDNAKAFLGIAGLFGYVLAVIYVGFPIATFAMMVYWLVISGWRRPLTIGIAGAGVTYGVLLAFIKVAYLPLPKGVGIFNDVTIEIYRTLGLF